MYFTVRFGVSKCSTFVNYLKNKIDLLSVTKKDSALWPKTICDVT